MNILQYTILLPFLCYSTILFSTAMFVKEKGSNTFVTNKNHPSPLLSNIAKGYNNSLLNEQNGTVPNVVMRIAVVAPLFESIPPQSYYKNGKMPTTVEEKTAQYVYDLVEKLVLFGHNVTLFASADSKTLAKLICDPAYPAMRKNRGKPGFWNHPYIWMFEQIRQRENEFDIIHFHTIEHFAHIKPYNSKTLTTLHDQPGSGFAGLELMRVLKKLFVNAQIVFKHNPSTPWKAVINAQYIIPDVDNKNDYANAYAYAYQMLYFKIHFKNETNKRKEMLNENSAQQLGLKNQQLAAITTCKSSIPSSLRIAIVSPPILDTLPPKKGGGTERMVYFLTQQLAKRGHKVTLIAPFDTEVSSNVNLVKIPFKTNPWAGKDNWFTHMLPVLASQKYVAAHAHEFDILHFHDSDHFVLMRDFLDNAVTTRHMPIDDATFFNTFRHIPMVSISNEQRRHVPKELLAELNWLATVHNGIPLEQLKFRQKPSVAAPPYLAWMGRMAPEKGVEIAIEFALKSGIKLKIAAQLVEEHKQSYWQKQIEPLIELNKNLVEYIGEIGGSEKDDFLGNALAFLFTPKWEEPFGLSMIEAMATGTPAIANLRGAVPEIVQVGRNGYVFEYDDQLGLDQVKQFVHLIKKAAQLDRSAVRGTVEQQWSLEKMAENYEAVYRQVLTTKRNKNCDAQQQQQQQQAVPAMDVDGIQTKSY